MEQQPQGSSPDIPQLILVPGDAWYENWSDPIMVYYHFAPAWLKDACEEAKKLGRDARRREILFAMCFAESYLFEWVRNDMADYDISTLNSYFDPNNNWRDVKTKWKGVAEQLCNSGRIPQVNWNSPYWQAFCTLVDYRNGLVHARSSRPQRQGQPEKERPMPSGEELDRLSPGWATRVVIDLVKYLHKEIGTPPVQWFTDMAAQLNP